MPSCGRMVWSKAWLFAMPTVDCAEPCAQLHGPESGWKLVFNLCMPEVKHLSDEQKEMVRNLSSPSQVDVQDHMMNSDLYTYSSSLLEKNWKQTWRNPICIDGARSDESYMLPWTESSNKKACHALHWTSWWWCLLWMFFHSICRPAP